MAFYGIIPARGGSKAIPGKNVAACGGRPLIAWTCDAARASTHLSRTIVSTDSELIAQVARDCGVDVPFLRPPELALDTTPSVDVMRHALEWLETLGENVTALVLLQPTSPLRTSAHIDAALELFTSSGAKSLVSVVAVPHRFHPSAVLREADGWLEPYEGTTHTVRRRQDVTPLYARNGPAILIVAPELLRRGLLYGDRTCRFVMPAESSVDIDDVLDLRFADFLLRARAESAGVDAPALKVR